MDKNVDIKKEMRQEIEEIRLLKKKMSYRSYKIRQSRLDKYRLEIEYLRHELKSPVNEIWLWIRRKHHLNISIDAIFERLHHWEKEHEPE